MSSREIALATLENIPGILAVLEQNLVMYHKSSPPTLLEQKGFLIHRLSAQDMQTAIQNPQLSGTSHA